MTHEQRSRPSERVEDGDNIVDRLRDCERALERRWCEPALLEASHSVTVSQLVGHGLHVPAVESRPTVQQENRLPFANHPAAERPTRCGRREASAIAHLGQPKTPAAQSQPRIPWTKAPLPP